MESMNKFYSFTQNTVQELTQRISGLEEKVDYINRGRDRSLLHSSTGTENGRSSVSSRIAKREVQSSSVELAKNFLREGKIEEALQIACEANDDVTFVRILDKAGTQVLSQ